MWVIRGRIVALTNDRSVAPTEGSVFTGRVWIDDRRPHRRGDQGHPERPARVRRRARRRCRQLTGDARTGRPAQPSRLQHVAAVDRAQPDGALPAPQLLDPGQVVRGEHDLARVRADHRLPAGTAGLRRDQGHRRWHHLDPGLAAEEPAAGRLAGPQHRGREVRRARRQPGLRLGAHRQAGRAGRAGHQDARRLDLHLPLRRGPAGQHRRPGVHRRRGGRLPAGAVHRGTRERGRPGRTGPLADRRRDRLVAVLQPLALRRDHRRAGGAGRRVERLPRLGLGAVRHQARARGAQGGPAHRRPPRLEADRPGTGDDGDLPARRCARARPGIARSAGCNPAPRPTWW